MGDIVYLTKPPPGAVDVTTPVVAPTVKKPGGNGDHVPPGGVATSVVVNPTEQSASIPDTIGVGATVTTAVANSAATTYDIVAVPGEMPVTIPLLAPTVATEGFELSQRPPTVASESGVEEPTQVVRMPVIGAAITVEATDNKMHDSASRKILVITERVCM